MANRANKPTVIKVDRYYYDNFFEPERKKLEKKLGVSLTQPGFTAYIARSGAKIKFPKIKNNFAPKKSRNGGFRFTI